MTIQPGIEYREDVTFDQAERENTTVVRLMDRRVAELRGAGWVITRSENIVHGVRLYYRQKESKDRIVVTGGTAEQRRQLQETIDDMALIADAFGLDMSIWWTR